MRDAIREILRRPLQDLGGLLVPVQLFCLVRPERLGILDRTGLDLVLGVWKLRRHLGEKAQSIIFKACLIFKNSVMSHLSMAGAPEESVDSCLSKSMVI